ncbi:MAG: hypothetical protein WA066_01125 [Candidatus Omnitrophota bacterium]
MKLALIIFLALIAVVLGFSVSSLRKELTSAQENAAFHEKRSEDLQRELMRVNRAYAEKERFLDEIEQSITELESKVQLETLERYIPKKTWSEIKPIIDRLKAFQEARENNNLSREHEEDN